MRVFIPFLYRLEDVAHFFTLLHDFTLFLVSALLSPHFLHLPQSGHVTPGVLTARFRSTGYGLAAGMGAKQTDEGLGQDR